MVKQNSMESLLSKLEEVEKGNEVELTQGEALIYGVDVADILPDVEQEEEGGDE